MHAIEFDVNISLKTDRIIYLQYYLFQLNCANGRHTILFFAHLYRRCRGRFVPLL